MILRHDIKRNLELEYPRAEEKLEKFNDRFDNNMSTGKHVNLWGFKNMHLRFATYSIVLKQNDDIRVILKYYVELGLAHFNLIISEDEKVEIKVNNKIYASSRLESKNELTSYNWWSLFKIAIIINDEYLSNELIRIFKVAKFKDSQDKFWSNICQYSLSLYLNNQSNEKLYLSIVEDANSGMVQYHGLNESKIIYSEDSKYIRSKFSLPIIELQKLIFERQDDLFNEKLCEYLEFKKAWTIKNKEQDNSSYWIDYSVLYCCILAKKNGVHIQHKSEYIPEVIINQKF